MANKSILTAFQKMWSYFIENLNEKSDKNHTHIVEDIVDFPDIQAFIYEAIYGFIDGSIEIINNSKATEVRDYAFYQHENLTEATFLNVQKIGNYSFYKNQKLTEVKAESVNSIGDFAFKGCSFLATANYPIANTIGRGCFDECESLTSINLLMVETIAPLSFRKCKSLTSIDFITAESIGSQAFYDSGLTSLTLRSNTVATLENADAFYFTPIEEGTGYIYVPSGLVDSYKTADGWSTYANQIIAIE